MDTVTNYSLNSCLCTHKLVQLSDFIGEISFLPWTVVNAKTLTADQSAENTLSAHPQMGHHPSRLRDLVKEGRKKLNNIRKYPR